MPTIFRLSKGLHVRLDGQDECTIEQRLPAGALQLKNITTNTYFSLTEEQLVTAWCEGRLELLGEGGGPSLAERRAAHSVASELSLLDDKSRMEIKRRFDYVSAVKSRSDGRLNQDALRQIVREVSASRQDDSPPSPITLYRWRKRYIASGEDLMALAPARKRRGNCKRKFVPGDEQRSNEVAKMIDAVIAEKYLSKERPTVADVHSLVVSRIATVNEFRDVSERLPVPHRNAVYRIVDKLDPYIEMKARYGERVANARYSPVGYAARPSRPLERVEMDHTRIDLMVVDPVMRLPVGRPVLTTAIDKFTGTILGTYKSFHPPGYLSVMHCLRHAIAPKTYLRQKYPAIINDWDAYGVPEVLVVDNGAEFHSTHFEDACLQMGIAIQYTPPKKPEYKGSQERWYRTQNQQLLHKQPGTTFSNVFDRGDYDPKKNAVITFDALDEMHHTYIVDIYHQQEHRGIGDIPARLWKAAIAEYPPALPPNRAALDVLLGCVAERIISAKGIELHGLLYNGDALALLRRRLKQDGRVTLKYDPSDLSLVHVADRERGIYLAVPAVNQDYAQGLSLWQHEVIKSYARRTIRESLDIVALCQSKQRIQEIVEREWLSSKRTTTRSRLARVINHGGETPLQLRGSDSSQDQLRLVNTEQGSLLSRPKLEDGAASWQPSNRKSGPRTKPQQGDAALPKGEGDNLDLTGWDAGYDLPK